jgi:hypothetical protein
VIRLPQRRLIYAAFLATLLIAAGIGITVASAVWSATSVPPVNRDLNRDFDGDYVQGLAERGIVRLPGYEPRPVVPISAATK